MTVSLSETQDSFMYLFGKTISTVIIINKEGGSERWGPLGSEFLGAKLWVHEPCPLLVFTSVSKNNERKFTNLKREKIIIIINFGSIFC